MSLPYSEPLRAPACWKNKIWTLQHDFQALSDLTTHLSLFPALSDAGVIPTPMPETAQRVFPCVTFVLCSGRFPAGNIIFPSPLPVTTSSPPQQNEPLHLSFGVPSKCSHLPPILRAPSLPSCDPLLVLKKNREYQYTYDTSYFKCVIHTNCFNSHTSPMKRLWLYPFNRETEAWRGWVIDHVTSEWSSQDPNAGVALLLAGGKAADQISQSDLICQPSFKLSFPVFLGAPCVPLYSI